MIKRFLWQRCIGYSADYKFTYLDGEAVMSDGSIQTVYCREKVDQGLDEWGTERQIPAIDNPNKISVEEAALDGVGRDMVQKIMFKRGIEEPEARAVVSGLLRRLADQIDPHAQH